MGNVKNIVLVQGEAADASGWKGVFEILSKKGYTITAVQNPLISLDADVEMTKLAIDKQDGPVVLVGHSWGGAVISIAGNHPKVAALVYVAAFAPDEGESVVELLTSAPPPVEIGVLPAAFSTKPGHPAWKDKPSHAVVATEDQTISPAIERNMYKRAKAKITEIKAGHAVYVSQPGTVADVIMAAAENAAPF